MSKTLHLVSLDVPYPPNYGGIINIFHTLRWLKQKGIGVYLHCFEYGNNPPNPILENYCEQVYYYPRKRSVKALFSTIPFITKTREHKELLNTLLQNDAPILFEGIHCARYLNHPKLEGRKRLIRAHNIEWQYYKALGKQEKNVFKKVFFYLEALKLYYYEPQMRLADVVFTVNANENYFFESNTNQTIYLPCLHGNDTVNCLTGRGNYLLYHGSLDVVENEEAVLWLLEHVFRFCPEYPVIIAGKNPSERLKTALKELKHIRLQSNLSLEAMRVLIQEAQAVVLYSKQNTGVKLKLIDTLFLSRFCIANTSMIKGSQVEEACMLADTPKAYLKTIDAIFHQNFTEGELQQRSEILKAQYDNATNIERLIEQI